MQAFFACLKVLALQNAAVTLFLIFFKVSLFHLKTVPFSTLHIDNDLIVDVATVLHVHLGISGGDLLRTGGPICTKVPVSYKYV
jgi:hypothetical protein